MGGDTNEAANLTEPEVIRKEFADGSLNWVGLYGSSYILLLFMQGACLCRCLKLSFHIVFNIIIALTKSKNYALFLTGFLMSIFLIFDFNTCIETQYPNDYETFFTEKDYGFTLFTTGLGLLPLYFISSYLGAYFIRIAKTENKKQIPVLIFYCIFETIILIQQIVLLLNWIYYNGKISHQANYYHNFSLFISFVSEKCLMLFLWIYFYNFYNYPSIYGNATIYQSPDPEIVLTEQQRTIITLLSNRASLIESQKMLQMDSIKGCTTCNICLDDIIKGELISSLSCDHIFHYECLQQWVKNNAYMSCPNCRAVIDPVENLSLKPKKESGHNRGLSTAKTENLIQNSPDPETPEEFLDDHDDRPIGENLTEQNINQINM